VNGSLCEARALSRRFMRCMPCNNHDNATIARRSLLRFGEFRSLEIHGSRTRGGIRGVNREGEAGGVLTTD